MALHHRLAPANVALSTPRSGDSRPPAAGTAQRQSPGGYGGVAVRNRMSARAVSLCLSGLRPFNWATAHPHRHCLPRLAASSTEQPSRFVPSPVSPRLAPAEFRPFRRAGRPFILSPLFSILSAGTRRRSAATCSRPPPVIARLTPHRHLSHGAGSPGLALALAPAGLLPTRLRLHPRLGPAAIQRDTPQRQRSVSTARTSSPVLPSPLRYCDA